MICTFCKRKIRCLFTTDSVINVYFLKGCSSSGRFGNSKALSKTGRHRLCYSTGDDCGDLHFVDCPFGRFWHTVIRPKTVAQIKLMIKIFTSTLLSYCSSMFVFNFTNKQIFYS